MCTILLIKTSNYTFYILRKYSYCFPEFQFSIIRWLNLKTREGITNSTRIICVGKTVINSFGFHEVKRIKEKRKQNYFYTFSKNEKFIRQFFYCALNFSAS